MMTDKTFLLTICVLACINVTSASANANTSGNQWHDHDLIREGASQFVRDSIDDNEVSIDIEVNSLDPRLKLQQCDKKLAFEFHGPHKTYGRQTVKVDCVGSTPWSLYLPVDVDAFRDVVITNRPLKRGAMINKNHIERKKVNVASLRYGYYADTNHVIGKVLKRSLPRNSVLTPKQLEAPQLVENGDTVTIISDSNGIQISAAAIAIGGGALGEKIRVKNASSGKIILAEVIGKRRLRVGN